MKFKQLFLPQSPRKENWWVNLLDKLSIGIVVTGGLAWLASYLLIPDIFGLSLESPQIIFVVLFSISLIVTVVITQNVSVDLSASAIVLLLLVIGIGNTYYQGVEGGASFVLVLAIVISGIFFGFKYGSIVLIVSVAMTAITSMAHMNANISILENAQWLWFVTRFFGVTLILLICVVYLISLLEKNITALEAENKSKKHVMDANELNASRLKLLMDISPDMVWAIGLDMNYSFVSSGVTRMLGYSVNEAMALGVKYMTLPAPFEQLMTTIYDELKNDDSRPAGRSNRSESTFVHKDGTHIPVEIIANFIRDTNGVPIGMQGITRDVRERKKLDSAMESILYGTRQSFGDDFFEALVKNLSRVLHVKYAFVGIKENARKIRSLVMCENGEVVDNIEYDVFNTPCAQVIQPSYCVFAKDVQLEFPDDELLSDMNIESYVGMPMMGSDGETIGLLVCMHDEPMLEGNLGENLVGIFAAHAGAELRRRLAEEEKEAIQQQLLQSQRLDSLGKMAGGVAHDFNNLLSVIGGYVDLAEKRVDGDDVLTGYHQQIRDASNRAAKITRQMLTFGRRQIMTYMPINLNTVLDEIEGLLAGLLPESIHYQLLREEKIGIVLGDSSQIAQVIMNLVVNARDVMKDGGTLTIETRNVAFTASDIPLKPWAREGNFVMFSVSDTGPGIPIEIVDHIFEPFFTMKPEGEGTGLGLSVYHGVVQQLEGFTELVNNVNGRTIFRTYLPIVDRVVSEAESKKADVCDGGSESILVVEDDVQVQVLAKEMLTKAGYQVVVADNGRKGLETYRQYEGKFSLIILDVMMPELNGHEVMTAIRATDSKVPILFTSGYSEDGIHTNFILRDKLVLLEKPYGLLQLLTKVREMINESLAS